MSASAHERLVIIGSGPAGYTAAIYAARAMVNPLLLSGFEPGGQLMITTDVENYPGFAEPIQGPWLMEQMRLQAEHVGARIENEYVTGLDLGQRPFRIRCDSGRTLTADAIILATGAKAKWLDLPGEERFKGFGVSACATCDGFFFRGKTVIVVGGGNSAVEEALYLANIAKAGGGRPSPRFVPRREDPVRAPVRAPQRDGALEQRRSTRSSATRTRSASPARACATSEPARCRRSTPTASSSPSATPRRPSSSPASSR